MKSNKSCLPDSLPLTCSAHSYTILVHVYIYVYIYAYIRISLYTDIYIYIYICTYLIRCLAPTVPPIERMANLLLYSPLPTPWTRTHRHNHIRTCTYTRTHTDIDTQTDTHTHRHKHMHIIVLQVCHVTNLFILYAQIFLTFTQTYYHGKLVDKSMKHA